MAITLKDFDFGAVDSKITLTERLNGSAFMKLGTKISLPLTGAIVTSISGITSRLVAEGGSKPVNGSGSKFLVGSNKFASIVVETTEAWQYDSRISDAVFEQQPKAHAVAFDAYISGLVAIPVEFTNYVSLDNTTQEVTISAGVEGTVDLDDARALVASGEATGIALSSSMLSYLRRQRVTTTGVRAFEITGTNQEGTIDGTPYAVFKSPVAVGYVGDFSRFFYGVDSENSSRFTQDGTVTDDNAVVHNLTQENKVALINEIRQGANVATLNDFVKITPGI